MVGRWFTADEMRCRCGRPECDAPARPAPELVRLLDQLRDAVGGPLVVTSGLRCAWWNEREGGEPNSGHVRGTEVDLACPTSRLRFTLLRAAFRLGVRRIGVYAKHVHVGIVDGTLPADVVWCGTYRAG